MKCEAAVCVDLKWGIAKDGKIPWRLVKDQQFFRELTKGKLCVMGRKTFDSLTPQMKDFINREALLFVFSSQTQYGDWETFASFREMHPNRTVLVCGGQDIYELFFQKGMIEKIYITKVLRDYDCDRFFQFPKSLFRPESKGVLDYSDHPPFRRDVYVKRTVFENEASYIYALQEVLMNGKVRSDRTGTGTLSTFGVNMTFDLRMGFPLLTTKKMYWKGIVEELLFFLRGERDTKKLEEKGIMIWKGNTSKEFQAKAGLSHLEEGDMGKMYGYQWRHYHDKIDQIQAVLNEIQNNPDSRRMFVTAWNPCQLDEMVLPPCHVSFQVYVDKNTKEMDMHMYQRSADMFLGVPFNIASYALLVHILCKLSGNLTPRRLHISIGDAHIYRNHIPQVKEQLGRMILEPPLVGIHNIKSVDDIKFEDIDLLRYYSHPPIKADMAV